MVKVYGELGRQETQRAIKWLDQRGLPFQFKDLRRDGISERALGACIDAFGWRMLIDGRNIAWRALPESLTLNLDRDGSRALMLELPQMLKSPIIRVGNGWLLGWSAANKVRLLGQVWQSCAASETMPNQRFDTRVAARA